MNFFQINPKIAFSLSADFKSHPCVKNFIEEQYQEAVPACLELINKMECRPDHQNDEDYFEISDDVLLATTEKLYLRDTAISLSSTVDGQADLVADTTIQVTAPTVNIEASTAITLESDSVTLGENGNTDVVLNFNATTMLYLYINYIIIYIDYFNPSLVLFCGCFTPTSGLFWPINAPKLPLFIM